MSSSSEGMVFRPDLGSKPAGPREARDERIVSRQIRDRRSSLRRVTLARAAQRRATRAGRIANVAPRSLGNPGRPVSRIAGRAGAAVRAARIATPVGLIATAVVTALVAGARALTGQNLDTLGEIVQERVFGGLDEEARAAMAGRRALAGDPLTLLRIKRFGLTDTDERVFEVTRDLQRDREEGASAIRRTVSAPTKIDQLIERIGSLFGSVRQDPRLKGEGLNIENAWALKKARERNERGRALR